MGWGGGEANMSFEKGGKKVLAFSCLKGGSQVDGAGPEVRLARHRAEPSGLGAFLTLPVLSVLCTGPADILGKEWD